MKRKRSIFFYLLASLFFTQGILDCGCLFAASASQPAAAQTSMPCHSSAKQGQENKSCCRACQLVKYAVSPDSAQIQAASPSKSFQLPDAYQGTFFSAESAAVPFDIPSLELAAAGLKTARSVSFSTPLYLSYGHLLI